MYFESYTNEQIQNLYKEFDRTEESLRKDVEYLMQWLEQQPHLPNVKDEAFLLNTLLYCKTQLEKAKSILENFYITKARWPEVFSDRDTDADEIKNVMLNFGPLIMVPKLTNEGHRIVIHRALKNNNEHLPEINEFLKAGAMVLEASVKENKNNGHILILDFENVTPPTITVLMKSAKKCITMAMKMFAFRFHKMYLVNGGPVSQILLKFVVNAMPKKLQEKAVIWEKSATDLAEVLQRDVLPSNYGGTCKSVEECLDSWYEYIKSFKEYFADTTQKADLTRIPKDSSYHYEMIETMEGSFRKLDVD